VKYRKKEINKDMGNMRYHFDKISQDWLIIENRGGNYENYV
jgi:hypothetical protein